MTVKTKTIPPQLNAIFETNYGSQRDEFAAWTDGVWRKQASAHRIPTKRPGHMVRAVLFYHE